MCGMPLASRCTTADARIGATTVPDVFGSGLTPNQYTAAAAHASSNAMQMLMMRKSREGTDKLYSAFRHRLL